MSRPLFISDKELADLAGTSQATISRMAHREGNFLGCVPLIVGRSRRWRIREIEAALGIARDEPTVRTPEKTKRDEPKVVGRWRTAKKRPNRWGEPVKVYGLGGAAGRVFARRVPATASRE